VSGRIDRPTDLFQLDPATCTALLTTQHVGRLVIGGDEPAVIPVNYRWVDGLITFRTGAGSRAAGSVAEPVVFEVDMFDERTRSGWSVVVKGKLRSAAGDEVHVDLDTWAPGERDQVMVLTPDSLSGRLLRGAVNASITTGAGYL
jgi:uncharacterized protein